jgi:uncharacterized protein with HEPN domain
MSEREDRVRLQHMLDASRQSIAFVQGRGRKDLDTDLQLTPALTRLVEIVSVKLLRMCRTRNESATQGFPGAPLQERVTDWLTRTSTSGR